MAFQLSFAQAEARNYTVKGLIVDKESGQPLEFATVSFFNAVNDLVAGGITELDGRYKLSVPE